jgi:site-specific DNA-methyltransferase (adenine-specific)
MVNEQDVRLGDCLDLLKELPVGCASLVYLDPPFFTGKSHRSSTRDGNMHYSFDDIWSHSDSYIDFLSERLSACKRVMREDASVFVHCDHNNVHLARQALNIVFGSDNFQSDIIWFYKRWSNAKRGLLQQHQTILFYSIGRNFKWRPMMVDYSATTNVDQILQKRERDSRGKAVYATDANGNVIYGGAKRGVPLGDVWDIPFLNPKAKERTGYPTQKPLLLIERIINLTTDEGDLVVDPFCGSGTTLVAAKIRGRRYFGTDISPDAVSLTKERLRMPIRTESALMRDGVDAYVNNDPWVEAHLTGLAYSRVQRNSGMDAILREPIDGQAVLIRVQREGEDLSTAVQALKKAIASKGSGVGYVIATGDDLFGFHDRDIGVIPSAALQVQRAMSVINADTLKKAIGRR